MDKQRYRQEQLDIPLPIDVSLKQSVEPQQTNKSPSKPAVLADKPPQVRVGRPWRLSCLMLRFWTLAGALYRVHQGQHPMVRAPIHRSSMLGATGPHRQ